jgi:diphthine synthase
VESASPILEALATEARVGLLVTGDPFVATTHVALRLQAEEAGHRWRYVPNASIATAAAGFLGLQLYRFGRTVSLPFPEPGFAPRSPVEGIRSNLGQKLHTLVLLDLRPAEGRFLRAEEALRILGERDPEGHAIGPESPVAVVARMGRDDASAWYGPRRQLESAEFGAPLHALVIPSEPLHFEEEAAIRRWRSPR